MWHIEAFLRYRIEKRSPSAENRAKLAEALHRLQTLADEVETMYAEQYAILSAEDIRTYVNQVRTAVTPAAAPAEPARRHSAVTGH